MFKNEYPATYRAVMAHLSRQKQAAATDSQPDDIPQAEHPSAPLKSRFSPSHRCVRSECRPRLSPFRSASGLNAQADLSISIDISGPTAASEVTAAAPAPCNQQVRARVVILGAP
ncbi:MAG: hypothetical protein DI537_02395 [Stutzerimonas stutzeri]|nr:MAG: hypothetical protein DI537_02395 [Stutzerimonas stutzeri]